MIKRLPALIITFFICLSVSAQEQVTHYEHGKHGKTNYSAITFHFTDQQLDKIIFTKGKSEHTTTLLVIGAQFSGNKNQLKVNLDGKNYTLFFEKGILKMSGYKNDYVKSFIWHHPDTGDRDYANCNGCTTNLSESHALLEKLFQL